jgi:hypothetical protein
MTTPVCTLPKSEVAGVWKELVDAASLVAVLQAAVLTQNDPPEPEDIHLLLGKIRQQLLDTANRLDCAQIDRQSAEVSDGG